MIQAGDHVRLYVFDMRATVCVESYTVCVGTAWRRRRFLRCRRAKTVNDKRVSRASDLQYG